MPNLVVATGEMRGRVFPLGPGPATIGRSPDCEVILRDVFVSARHARVEERGPGAFAVVDLQSQNGTFVNDRTVSTADLRFGDEIRVGETVLVLSEDGRASVSRAARYLEDFLQSDLHARGVAPTKTPHLVGEETLSLPRSHAQTAALFRLLSYLTRFTELDEFLREVLSVLATAARARAGAILLNRPGGDDAIVRARIPGEAPARPATIQLAEETARSGRPSFRQAAPDDTQGAIAVLPLHYRGEPAGAVLLESGRGGTGFPAEDLRLLDLVAAQISVALSNLLLIEELRVANRKLSRAREDMASLNASLEATVAEKTRELRRTAERLRELYDGAPVMYVTLDADRSVRECNRTGAEMLGLPLAEALGRRADDLVQEESRAALREACEAALAGERVSGVDVRLRRPDGSAVEAALAAVASGTGPGAQVRAVVRDVTAERELRRRLARTERLAALGAVSAGIAHEIRNPLAGISATVQHLLGKGPADDPNRSRLERISLGVSRMESLVGRVLAFAAPPEPHPEAVAAQAMADEALAIVEDRAQRAGVAVVRAHGERLRHAFADRGQVVQALLNLLGNALDAMPKGGTLRVATREAPGGKVEIAVGDTGPGIPAQDLPHLFEPFFTRGKPTGTGLGLAISHAMIARNGGEILVETEPGRGSVFRIRLPAAPEVRR
ncbi:MAG: ATP-binding protein [Planctomycetales bacterium]|nr:ATP-binding protein [Planctomycetales bacterium]